MGSGLLKFERLRRLDYSVVSSTLKDDMEVEAQAAAGIVSRRHKNSHSHFLKGQPRTCQTTMIR